MKSLESLSSDELLDTGLSLSTAEALVMALRGREEVVRLRKLFACQAVGPSDVRKYVAELLKKVELGKRSAWDVSLAALAVSFERQPGPFADQFLRSLAALRIAELPLSPRVAQLVAENRTRFFAGTTEKRFRFAKFRLGNVEIVYHLNAVRDSRLSTASNKQVRCLYPDRMAA